MLITYINPACEAHTGTSLDGARGRRWSELFDGSAVSLASIPGAPGMVGVVAAGVNASPPAGGPRDGEARRLDILHRIITAANTAMDMDSLLETALGTTLELMEFDGGGILVVDPGGATASLRCSRGLPGEFAARMKQVPVGAEPYSTVFVRKNALFSGEYRGNGKASPAPGCGTSFAGASVPIIFRDAVIGSLNVMKRGSHLFTDFEKEILKSTGREMGAFISRMLAEQALAESEKKFRELADALPEVVFEADAQGRIIYANRRAFQLFGYTGEELAGGIRVFDLIIPGDLPRVIENWKRRMEGEPVGPIEYSILRKSGEVFPGLINVAPVLRDGAIVGMRGILIDISRQKEAEEALRRSEARFRALTESSPAMIYIYQDGRIQYANPAMIRTFGYSMDEIGDKDLLERSLHPDSVDYVKQRMKARDEGEPGSVRFEIKVITKSGEVRVLDLSAGMIEYNGRPAAIGSAFDITEARRMEEELLNMRKLESLGVLAGGIAHDFNNLLTAIIGNVSLARITLSQDHPVYRNLVEMENASLRARDLTHQLLTFSKGGAPVKKTASIARLLRETIQFTLSGSHLMPEFAIADDLWDANIDQGQVSQVVNNIAMNAAQASPSGVSLEISAANVVLDAPDELPLDPGRYVKISFTDHGAGIPADVLSRVFDPYFTTKSKGNGLGLTTSYSIIRKHGGHITASSQPGRGSCFTVYLPASSGNAEAVRGAVEPLARTRGSILLMDDDDAVLQVAKSMLEYLGYETACVHGGEEAIESYARRLESGAPFDAVIMDLTIRGGMGAVEAVKALRKIDPGVKALVSSGYSLDPILVEHGRHGFAGTVGKPYDVNRIAKTLRETIKSR